MGMVFHLFVTLSTKIFSNQQCALKLDTLAKIRYVLCQQPSFGVKGNTSVLTKFTTSEGSKLISRPFKNGNMLGYYTSLTGFACSRFVGRSVHLLHKAINSSWLPRDHKWHAIVT